MQVLRVFQVDVKSTIHWGDSTGLTVKSHDKMDEHKVVTLKLSSSHRTHR
jgi:hypothetical protein